jgi:DNA-binding transcriptional LysR family regulator
MDLHQLRCFVAAAEELHFGKAARRLDMLPSALGRYVHLLEKELGARLMSRTTRRVELTDDGAFLLERARSLLHSADDLESEIRKRARSSGFSLRVGTIDSAAAGLLPRVLRDFRIRRPDVTVQLVEDKTIRLLPLLLSGRLDLAFVRPPATRDKRFALQFLLHETAVVAVPAKHPLSARKAISVAQLAGQPLIVPERRSRPHSHDLTMKLFANAGIKARVVQVADEKQTIINLVSANLGIAIVPRWTSQIANKGVKFIAIRQSRDSVMKTLPLAAAWVAGARDPVRDEMIGLLRQNLEAYARRS